MAKNDPVRLDVKKIISNKAPHIVNKIPAFVITFLEKLICQDGLNDLLLRFSDKEGVDFAESLLNDLNIQLQVEGLDKLPKHGRYTFASNHPLGGLDGISLVYAIGSNYDGNVKCVVNDLLMNIRNFAPVFLPINKHGSQGKATADVLNTHYASDEQMIVFPAGLVSRWQNGTIKDVHWKKGLISKSIEHKRDIVPVYFEGKNSKSFYFWAYFRKLLGIKFNFEMILLPRELFKNRNRKFIIRLGDPISWQSFDKTQKLSFWAENVRQKVYELEK